MDAKDNMELIHLAIQQLLEENRGKASAESFVEDGEDQLLLSRLLSQLDSLKEEKTSKPPQPPSETKVLPCSAVVIMEAKDETVREPGSASTSTETGTEEIVRELRKVKRQNSVTHWLLSVMIFLTAAWQLSEVSLILTVKNKVSNPFRSLGSMVKGVLKVCGVNERDEEKPLSKKQPQIEAPSLPTLKIPELDLPILGLYSEEN